MLKQATRRVLVVRTDNLGDVILTGPAVRAVAASGAQVVYLCSPRGRPAAAALPGVSRVVTARLPWIDPAPLPVTRTAMDRLASLISDVRADQAIIFTSFHQSPLPLALVARMAGVEALAAISVDYPGSLLDVRHAVPDDVHEVERNLSLAEAAGYPLPAGDDRRLRLQPGHHPVLEPEWKGRYVVVHPGASVPARAWPEHRHADLIAALVAAGHHVVLTGSPAEVGLADRLAATVPGRAGLTNLAGRTDLRTLVSVIAGAAVVVCGNTGPAHIAAATGTPVVSIYAPTVPAVRWRPWMTPHILLGHQHIACAGCRARTCPVPGHPCVGQIPVPVVLSAVEELAAGAPRPVEPPVDLAGGRGA